MTKFEIRARNKSIFKVIFCSLLSVVSIFVIFASSFILKDTIELLNQDDFVIGQVFNNEESDTLYEVNGLREIEGNNVQQRQELSKPDVTYLEFNSPSGRAVLLTHEVRFVNENGRIYSIQNFLHEENLVLPDLPSTIIENYVTYTLTWLEQLDYVVREDATYHFAYRAL